MLNKLFSKASKATSNKQQESQWYKSCAELPLFNFIKVVTTSELKWLIVEGEPSNEQLAASWNDIFTEYCDICPSDNSSYTKFLLRDIEYLKGKLTIISVCVAGLIKGYNEALISILRGYDFYFDYTSDTMLEDLEKTVIQSKQFEVALEVKQNEYEKYILNQPKETSTDHDYEDLLSVLSKYQGYELDSKKLTVSRFVGIFNRFKQENKSNGQQSKD